MSKTASLGLMPSASLFGRMMTAIDRLLMAHARIAIRNGDFRIPGSEPAAAAQKRENRSARPG